MVEIPIERYDSLAKSEVLLSIIRHIVMDSDDYVSCGDIKKMLEVINDDSIRD